MRKDPDLVQKATFDLRGKVIMAQEMLETMERHRS
jgi:hypothetical protein